MIYEEDLNWTKANKKSVSETLIRFKRKKPKEVDELFHRLHNEVFEKTDCLKCANCCKTTSPIFRDVDIERLAKHLRIKSAQLIAKYLHLDSDGDYVLNFTPCPFLESDNYCSVYEYRPLACKEYPHTNRKNIQQILKLTTRNTEICPAVSRIVQKILQKQNI
ncbi:MAG: YkgJ family cysteine cluster protein [Flavobacteriales bacterium]